MHYKEHFIKAAIIAVLILACTLPLAAAVSVTGTVVGITDGDTIKIAYNDTTMSCRLAGLDTPESYMNVKAQNDVASCKVLDYIMMHTGLMAKEYLEAIFKPGDIISFEIIGTDPYKRSIIFIPNVNIKIISDGMGEYWPTPQLSKDMRTILENEESMAVSKQLGIWRYLKKPCL